MTSTKSKAENFLELLDELADSALDAPREELEQEMRADGLDPKAVATRMQARAQAILKKAGETRRLRLQATKPVPLRSKAATWSDEQVKSAVEKALAKPTSLGQMTMQWRDGKNQSPSDLRSLLDNLLELGLVDNEPEEET